MTSSRQSPPAGDLTAVRRSLARDWFRLGFPAGLMISAYYGIWGPVQEGGSYADAVLSNVISFLAFAALFILLVGPRLSARLDRDLAWWSAGQVPTRADQEQALALPAVLAARVLGFMLAMSGMIAIGNRIFQDAWDETARVFIGLVLTSLTFAATAFLIAERSLRPAFSAALSVGFDTSRRGVGVRRRLVLAWALGSGIPLLFVLAIPLGYVDGRDAIPMSVPVVFMAVIGLSAGLTLTTLVSHSVADPIASVRDAMRRVREGDVDAAVTVDDGGEIGLLQSGFNEMVEGLRERRQLEDLFGRHVGEDVARNALARGVQLGGETRGVTALFVDLVGSTAMAEAMEPAAVVATLNSFFTAVVDAVGAEGGWVNKFEGDGALCVFGAPVDDDDHARRALRAARAMRDALDRLGLHAGIGISTGEAVAGNVGTERRYEYTVIGRPVNEAARLTDAAKRRPVPVLASARTVRVAGDEATRWRAAGSLELRGVAGAVEVYEPG